MPRLRDGRALVLALLAFGLTRLAGGRLAWFLFYGLLLLAVAAVTWSGYLQRRLRVGVQAEPAHLQVGKTLTIRVAVAIPGPVPVPWLEADQQTPPRLLADPAPRLAATLAGGSALTLTFQARVQRRGYYAPGPIRIRTGDGFGLFAVQREVHADRPVTVLPPVKPLRGLALAGGAVPGQRAAGRWGEVDPAGIDEIRPYQPGDGLRHIHWPTSARKGTLHVKTYERTAAPALVLVPDLAAAAHRTVGGWDSLEVAVLVTAALAGAAAERGQEAGLCAAGGRGHGHRVPPGRGARTLARILATLAVVQADGPRPLAAELPALRGLWPARATVCTLTPALTPALVDALLALRSRHVVLLVAVAPPGGPVPGAELLPVLAARGIATYVPEGDPETAPEVRLRAAGGWAR